MNDSEMSAKDQLIHVDPSEPPQHDIESSTQRLDRPPGIDETEQGDEKPDEPEPAIDALGEASRGNFLPVLMIFNRDQTVDLSVYDTAGYSISHYAVCFANFQVDRY